MTPLSRATNHVLTHGGGTFLPGHLTDAELTSGYMVGGVVPAAPSAPATPLDARAALEAFLGRPDVREALDGCETFRTATFVGGWIDAAGRVVWDVSECYHDEHDALYVAASRGEDAVWDNARQDEIILPARMY